MKKVSCNPPVESHNDVLPIEFTQHALYTAEEEKDAFARLKQAEEQYGRDSEEWQKIRNEIMEHNYRLVVQMVFRFRQKAPASMELQELFNVGCLGLMRAIDKFEPSKGNRFSTYAVPWLRRMITGEAASYDALGRSIRVIAEIRRIKACQKDYEMTYGCTPEPTQLASMTGLKESIVASRLQNAEMIFSLDSFLEQKKTDSQAVTLSDLLPADEDVALDYEERQEYQAAYDAMDLILSESCKKVICRYYGLGCEQENLKQIATSLGCSTTYVGHMVKKGLVALNFYLETGLLPVPKRRGANKSKVKPKPQR